MDRKEVEEKVKKILEERLKVKNVVDSSHLTEDLGMDSFGMVELLFEAEKIFGIEIPEQDMRDINTVGEVIDYIYNKVSKK